MERDIKALARSSPTGYRPGPSNEVKPPMAIMARKGHKRGSRKQRRRNARKMRRGGRY